MITQEDTVFVSGMSPALTEEDIQQHFGAIGVIKVSTFSRLPPLQWMCMFMYLLAGGLILHITEQILLIL
jgi:RNA recognition motif-containing protein